MMKIVFVSAKTPSAAVFLLLLSLCVLPSSWLPSRTLASVIVIPVRRLFVLGFGWNLAEAQAQNERVA